MGPGYPRPRGRTSLRDLGLAAHAAPEGFVAEAAGTNLFARFLQGSSHPRPLYYYLYQLPIAFLPWTLRR